MQIEKSDLNAYAEHAKPLGFNSFLCSLSSA